MDGSYFELNTFCMFGEIFDGFVHSQRQKRFAVLKLC